MKRTRLLSSRRASGRLLLTLAWCLAATAASALEAPSINIVTRAVQNGVPEERALVPGMSLRTGDGVRIEVSSAERAFVYVFAIGASGSAVLLRPFSGVSAEALIQGGDTVLIPEAPAFLPLDRHVGRETIVALASRTPVRELDELLLNAEEIVADAGALPRDALDGFGLARAVTFLHTPPSDTASNAEATPSRPRLFRGEPEESGVLSGSGSRINALLGGGVVAPRPLASTPAPSTSNSVNANVGSTGSGAQAPREGEPDPQPGRAGAFFGGLSKWFDSSDGETAEAGAARSDTDASSKPAPSSETRFESNVGSSNLGRRGAGASTSPSAPSVPPEAKALPTRPVTAQPPAVIPPPRVLEPQSNAGSREGAEVSEGEDSESLFGGWSSLFSGPSSAPVAAPAPAPAPVLGAASSDEPAPAPTPDEPRAPPADGGSFLTQWLGGGSSEAGSEVPKSDSGSTLASAVPEHSPPAPDTDSAIVSQARVRSTEVQDRQAVTAPADLAPAQVSTPEPRPVAVSGGPAAAEVAPEAASDDGVLSGSGALIARLFAPASADADAAPSTQGGSKPALFAQTGTAEPSTDALSNREDEAQARRSAPEGGPAPVPQSAESDVLSGLGNTGALLAQLFLPSSEPEPPSEREAGRVDESTPLAESREDLESDDSARAATVAQSVAPVDEQVSVRDGADESETATGRLNDVRASTTQVDAGLKGGGGSTQLTDESESTGGTFSKLLGLFDSGPGDDSDSIGAGDEGELPDAVVLNDDGRVIDDDVVSFGTGPGDDVDDETFVPAPGLALGDGVSAGAALAVTGLTSRVAALFGFAGEADEDDASAATDTTVSTAEPAPGPAPAPGPGVERSVDAPAPVPLVVREEAIAQTDVPAAGPAAQPSVPPPLEVRDPDAAVRLPQIGAGPAAEQRRPESGVLSGSGSRIARMLGDAEPAPDTAQPLALTQTVRPSTAASQRSVSESTEPVSTTPMSTASTSVAATSTGLGSTTPESPVPASTPAESASVRPTDRTLVVKDAPAAPTLTAAMSGPPSITSKPSKPALAPLALTPVQAHLELDPSADGVLTRAVVLIVSPNGIGTGVVVGSDGHILTNWHVVRGFTRVTVWLKAPGQVSADTATPRLARVVRTSRVSDLALLTLTEPVPDLSPVPLASVAKPERGALLHVVGHQRGDEWAHTMGRFIARKERHSWLTDGRHVHREAMVRVRVSDSAGGSGGALFNEQLQMIGINTHVAKRSRQVYAVSVESIRRFLSGEPQQPL